MELMRSVIGPRPGMYIHRAQRLHEIYENLWEIVLKASENASILNQNCIHFVYISSVDNCAHLKNIIAMQYILLHK